MGRKGQLHDFPTDEIEFVIKDPNSAAGECRSFHKVPGGYIVNGDPVTEATEARLQHRGEGERATFIDDETMAAFIAKVSRGG